VRFLLVAGDVDLHRRRGKEEGKKSIQTPLLLGFSCGGAWHAPPVTVACGGDVPPMFLLSFGFTELVPALLWMF
jgi:hypothetical protein